jgi:hypothetical protein
MPWIEAAKKQHRNVFALGAWVLSSRADEYRKNAEECRRQAARSKHADDRERWLRVAQHFQQLAREAEIEQPQQS